MREHRGTGRTIFAALLLGIGGVLNVVWGIAALSNSHFFARHQHYLFGGLHSWGWATLILGILELIASASLFSGGEYGRWFAIAVGSLVALDALFDITARPFWSLAVFALSLWIVYGLVIWEPPSRLRAS